MPASALDKASEAANGDIPAAAHVTGTRATGVTSLSVDTQQFWPVNTGVKFSTYKVDTTGNKIAGSQTDWKGVSNGSNTINNMVRTGGAADGGNAIGDVVVMGPTAQWGEDFVEAFLLEHSNPTGQHGDIHATSVDSAGLITAHGGLNVPAGQVVTGILSHPYKFFAYTNADYSASFGFLPVHLNAVVYDDNSNFNVSTYTYTAPIDGVYHFDGFVAVITPSSASNIVYLKQVSGGVETDYIGDELATSGSSSLGVSIGIDLKLTAGDTIQLITLTTAGENVFGKMAGPPATYRSRLSGHLVSK